MKPCVKCGRGTASVTGYCRKNCTFKQVYTANKAKRERDEKAAQMKQERADMNAYIDHLLTLDWTAAQCLTTPPKTPPSAESATCG